MRDMESSATAKNVHLKLLLVEDNPSDAALFSKALAGSNSAAFEIRHETTLAKGLEACAANKFDIIVLDLSLPDSDGVATLEGMIKQPLGIPVIVLTGSDNEAMGIQAMRLGAEEYLVKGESVDLARFVLLAFERYKGRALKDQSASTNNLCVGNVEVDLMKQVALINAHNEKKAVSLTSIEFRILVFLMKNVGDVVSRSQIVSEIWAEDEREISSRTVDKHISSLKRKCSPALDQIQGVYGVGYTFSH